MNSKLSKSALSAAVVEAPDVLDPRNKPPRGSFSSTTKYPEPGCITPSAVDRPKVVSVLVLEVAYFAC